MPGPLPANPRAARRAAALALAIVATLSAGPTTAGAAPGGAGPRPMPTFQGEEGLLPDYDARAGRVYPSAVQQEIVNTLGAVASWNDFGTPQSLIDYDGDLGAAPGNDFIAVARNWITRHRALFRLSERGIADLEVIGNAPIGKGRAVRFRQTFGGLAAGRDGGIVIGVLGNRVVYAASSATGDGHAPPAPGLTPLRAYLQASADVGLPLDPATIRPAGRDREWYLFEVDGYSYPQRARLRALPAPSGRVHVVWETLILKLHGVVESYTHFVDAVDGRVLLREDLVKYVDPPQWRVFPGSPPVDYSFTDTREMWCWDLRNERPHADCQYELKNDAPPVAFDVDVRLGTPRFTTWGNAAVSGEAWLSPLTPAEQYRPISPQRIYHWPWTNQWYESKCDFSSLASPRRNDIDAAVTNLFVMHNRMHDWAYHLGFTEETWNLQEVNKQVEGETVGAERDPEIGNAQAGALTGGTPVFLGRDNANQITPADGVPPITNMYLWQPIAGAFYGPCVDGDYDMAVIGHEYTHAISNRMVGGPDSGLSGPQAGAMGESWSDLFAVEYLNEFSFVPIAKENPFAVGVYVTGDPESAIRNYGMNHSPLNYSNVGYDVTGPQVHADGEIWSAVNYNIREALAAKYDNRYPENDKGLQRRCAEGKLAAGRCPGNRRWIQIAFDAFLLMEPQVSMLDSRDAYLAADKMRFEGANREVLWREFAQGGLGAGAKTNQNNDPDPIPSFKSPFAANSEVTFVPLVDEGPEPKKVAFYVGDYEDRSVPVADTDPDTDTERTAPMVPGKYRMIARAEGFGMKRFIARIEPGRTTLRVRLQRNLASVASGAKFAGDGTTLEALGDDTEATAWQSLGAPGPGVPPGLPGYSPLDVEGRQVTVDLAGADHRLDRVQVSAMLSPGMSRFSALRSFAIEVCVAKKKGDCGPTDRFKRIYRSPNDAFPAIAPRPKAPHLIMREFDIPDVRATHVRLVVLTNQCTGTRAFRGDQDNDPLNNSHCPNGLPGGSSQSGNVRAAELQVFAR